MVLFQYSQSKQKDLLNFGIVLIFCIVPLIGLSLALIVALSNRGSSRRDLYLLFLLLAIYIGCINSTKIPESDQFMYYDAYRLVPHRTFMQSLMGIYGSFQDYSTKEMGFGLFNFVGYYVSGGSYALFVVLGTVLMYMLYYDGIYRYFHYVKVDRPGLYIIAGVLMLTFFTQFFNLTIHLERQYLATSFVVYALIRTITENKVNWSFLIIGLSMHTSLGIFLPIFLLRQFKKNLDLKWSVAIILLLVIAMSSLNFILGSLFSAGDSYVMGRLQDMNEEGREDRMSISLVLMLAVPMVFVSLKNIWMDYREFMRDEVLLYLVYLFILIFALSNPNNTMQYRFFMMTYSFVPFILPMLFRKATSCCKLYLSFVSLFLIVRFFLTFDDISFKFAPCEDVMTMNIFSLFNYYNFS